MAKEVRIEAHVTVDGVDSPGFEGGLRRRFIVSQVESFSTLIQPGEEEPGENPAVSSIGTSQAIAIVASAPITIYLGSIHTEGIQLGAGGFIIIAGVQGKANGPDLWNNSDAAVRIEGIVGGSV